MGHLVFTLLIIISCCSFKVLAAGNPVDGQTKSQVCVACHGADGNSTTPIWPKIAGLSEGYLLIQLMEFKKGQQGDRYDPTMYGIVQNLSQQDLEGLAAYYSTQVMTDGAAKKELVALGQKIFRGGNTQTGLPACAGCHGADGSGNLARFPRLAGQNSAYISAQLNMYKTRARKNGIMMEDVADRLTSEEIEAVASYVAGLH
jgi:cytochrome c553